MADMFGLRISLGSISNIEARFSNGLAPFHAEAMEDRQDADVKHADETTWRQRGKSAYLWLAATLTTVAYLIRNTRSGEVAKELLGETPTGITVSDRYIAYNYIDEGQRQVYWAHLRRDFVAMAEGENEHRPIGVKLLKLTDEMFKRWHSLRDSEITRGQFGRACLGIRIQMFALLDKGAKSRGHRTPSLCRGILKTEGPMWTFVDVDGVEPTNKGAECAIRPAVIPRKCSAPQFPWTPAKGPVALFRTRYTSTLRS